MVCKSGFFGKWVFQYLATVTGTFSLMSYGVNTCWTSPYLPYLLSNSSIIPMTSDQASWCAIAPLIGCLPGALVAANIADRIGRKYTILIMAPVVFGCQIGIGYVRNVWYLSLLRMIIGITEGACYTALPMYIGEIASPDIRGFLSSLITTFFILGMLLVNALGSFLSIWTSSMISAIIPAIHFFSFLFMPESPYFYIKVKKYEQAERSLRIFQGTTVVAKEMEVIKGAVRMQEEMADSSKLTDLFTIPSNRRGMLIFIILSTSVRAAARAPLTSYNRFIFEESGSSISPRISAISNCAVELVVATFTTYFIIDRFGKRFLVIVSSAGCSVTLFIMGLYFYLKDFHNDVIDHLNWLPITTLISNNVMYNMGISFAVMCYLSELFPTNVKAKAMSFAQMYTVATAAATTKVFQIMNDRFGTLSVSFFCFSVFSMMMLFFIVKYVPETRGKTLEEIQLFLNEKHSARQDEKKTSEK